jgi:hypothetical protein
MKIKKRILVAISKMMEFSELKIDTKKLDG